MEPELALDLLLQVERDLARLHAVQVDLLVAVADPEPRSEQFLVLDPRPDHDEQRTVWIEDAVREEVAAALRWSPSVAQARIDAARLLHGPLSDTRAALMAGEISYAQARSVVEAAERLSSRLDRDPKAPNRFAAQCRLLQERVLPVARRSTLARTRVAGARAVERIDPAGQAVRRSAARRTRDVWVGPECDGIAPLVAHLDALTARAILAAVGASASAHEGGARTAQVLVAIPAEQLLGGVPGAELDGLSLLLADPAVRCTLRPVITDSTDGHVLDVGRRSYRLPAALRRLIVTRDATCRFPGCGQPATRAQVDHATPWDEGGGSDAANLGALCTRHHQLKTLGGWRITDSRADGGCRWHSPTGRRYDHDPPPF